MEKVPWPGSQTSKLARLRFYVFIDRSTERHGRAAVKEQNPFYHC